MGKLEVYGGHGSTKTTEPDHTDAWNVAHYRQHESNLACAYIELRQLSKVMWEGPITDEEQERLKAILHANDI